MGLSSMFFPLVKPALKRVIEDLLSLNSAELGHFTESLVSITAPISRRSFRKAAQGLAPKIARISENDLTEALALVCQLVRDNEMLEPIEEISEMPTTDRDRFEALLKTFNANRPLAKVIALDRFIDRGPRIRHLSWVCDLRTKIPGISGTFQEAEDRKDDEEIRIALSIFRLRIDDWDWPVYFQVTESELDELIGELQRARTQLQRLNQSERQE